GDFQNRGDWKAHPFAKTAKGWGTRFSGDSKGGPPVPGQPPTLTLTLGNSRRTVFRAELETEIPTRANWDFIHALMQSCVPVQDRSRTMMVSIPGAFLTT